MDLSIVTPSLWEFRIREWSDVPTVLVRAPWVLVTTEVSSVII